MKRLRCFIVSRNCSVPRTFFFSLFTIPTTTTPLPPNGDAAPIATVSLGQSPFVGSPSITRSSGFHAWSIGDRRIGKAPHCPLRTEKQSCTGNGQRVDVDGVGCACMVMGGSPLGHSGRLFSASLRDVFVWLSRRSSAIGSSSWSSGMLSPLLFSSSCLRSCGASPSPCDGVLLHARRGVKLVNPSGIQGGQHYGKNAPALIGGKDLALKHTEMYDGFTDDFGVFKEGPPVALRLEYVRSPVHGYSQQLLQKDLWSPFQVGRSLMHYTPLYYDWKGFSSRDYWGHRSGTNPGSKVVMGHYKRDELRSMDQRVMVHHHGIRRVPKWLACVVNYPRQKSFVGFFLYATGAYAVELLTYKQLPRLVYNKPFQGCFPTLGQSVALEEVTYGKEVHSVEAYPEHGGVLCRASGTAAIVLRGSEPHLIPLLLPSKEVRLFDQVCGAVFGRRAGVMYRYQRNFGSRNVEANMPHRPKVHSKSKRVSAHPAGGGNAGSANLLVPLDWRLHPRNAVKTKYWLSGYILRGRQYNKNQTVADAKTKVYSWASRDSVYR